MAAAMLKLVIIFITLSNVQTSNLELQKPNDNHLQRKPHNDDQLGYGLERRHCDEDACETVVIKCQATNRCRCDIKQDAHCAKDCVDCLEERFGKCCACVDLCPSPVHDTFSSHVGDILFDKNYEGLFEVLTEEDDIHGRWVIKHRTMTGDTLLPEHRRDSEFNTVGSDNHLRPGSNGHCTMAFINKYLNMLQCRRYCKSMGAVRYRWFEDGCCECLGKHCHNYGSENPQCNILPFE